MKATLDSRFYKLNKKTSLRWIEFKQNSKQSGVDYLLTHWNICGAHGPTPSSSHQPGFGSSLPPSVLAHTAHRPVSYWSLPWTPAHILIAERFVYVCSWLRCHLWSIELLCLYFCWLQLFLFLFSMCNFWETDVFSVWMILLTLSKNLLATEGLLGLRWWRSG